MTALIPSTQVELDAEYERLHELSIEKDEDFEGIEAQRFYFLQGIKSLLSSGFNYVDLKKLTDDELQKLEGKSHHLEVFRGYWRRFAELPVSVRFAIQKMMTMNLELNNIEQVDNSNQ